MSYNALRRALSIILALLLAPNVARADPGTRLFGGAVVETLGTSVALADESPRNEPGGFGGGVEFGGSASVLDPHFAVLGIGRVMEWTSSWSGQRGERRGRFELALGPELRFPTRFFTIRVGVPLGYSKAWIYAGPGRAVREEYDGGHGVTLGAVAGADIWGKHHGGYFGLSYAARINWFTHRTELIAATEDRASERYRFTTHAALLSGGYAYRF